MVFTKSLNLRRMSAAIPNHEKPTGTIAVQDNGEDAPVENTLNDLFIIPYVGFRDPACRLMTQTESLTPGLLTISTAHRAWTATPARLRRRICDGECVYRLAGSRPSYGSPCRPAICQKNVQCRCLRYC